MYERFAIGEIHWAKLWYADLGDSACKDLALWTHENLTMEMCGFRNYYLSDNSNKRSSMTFLATHLLDRNRQMSVSDKNAGGWANSTLNTFMNSRMYNSIELEWRQLIKQVKIKSTIGNKSSETFESNCYLTVPAVYSVASTDNEIYNENKPYASEGSLISYIKNADERIRKYEDGEIGEYWTRSPNVNYDSYFFTINESGEPYGYNLPYNAYGILVEFSI